MSPDKLTRIILSAPFYSWLWYQYGWQLPLCILAISLVNRIGRF